jgi:dipeptidyl aminopeptidase/acylaminoacyl peptidase
MPLPKKGDYVLRKGSLLLAAAMAAAWGGCADAQTVAVDPDAAVFGVRESAIGLNLSPSGKFVAYVAPSPGGGAIAFIADVQSGDSKPFLNSGKGGDHLRWCRFVTDQRLICRYTAIMNDAGTLIGFSRLVAINSDGSGIKQLGQESSFYDAGYRQTDGDVLDWLPGGGGSVLMARDYVPESGKTGTRLIRSKNGYGVDRVDTATLKATPVEAPHPGIDSYWSDGQGNVRLMSEAGIANNLLTGKTKYYYRAAATREWKTLIDFDDDDDFVPLAVDATSDSLYVLKPLNGRKALYRIKLDGSLSSALIASHPKVDIDNVIRSANGQRVIGYTYATDKRTGEYFDPEYKALVSSLGHAVPNLPIIDIENASTDGGKVLIFAGADNDPGRYFVFDKKTKNLAEILLVRPELENKKLASVKPVSATAADGISVPAYLTLPPGKEARNLPAVVLPHGGPSARDEWGFDWLAQYLAARGYAVLQPNYRGSAGYGDAWLMQNGFKSWRTSIGDITASARWLVSQGIADPKRLAIVGWSYGGYAALQSAITEPNLFKAVVAIAPVTDLTMLKKESEEFTNREVMARFIGAGPHVIEGSPLRHAAAIRVPVLLIHGDLDQNVGVLESERMDEALRAAGTQVEFLRFKSLDHQLEDSAARKEMLTKVGQLLEKTIGR